MEVERFKTDKCFSRPTTAVEIYQKNVSPFQFWWMQKTIFVGPHFYAVGIEGSFLKSAIPGLFCFIFVFSI